jgi:hypothetical protein
MKKNIVGAITDMLLEGKIDLAEAELMISERQGVFTSKQSISRASKRLKTGYSGNGGFLDYSIDESGVAWIDWTESTPEGQGYHSILFNELKDILWENGIKRLRVRNSEENTHMQKINRGYGFQEVDCDESVFPRERIFELNL